MEKEEELVQYYVVNKELHMSEGKLGVQMAHAATISSIHLVNDEVFQKWYSLEQKKIALRGKEKDLLKLEAQGFFAVRDAGYTEIPPNSLTVVALPPMKRSEAKQYIKRLQLL